METASFDRLASAANKVRGMQVEVHAFPALKDETWGTPEIRGRESQ